MGFSVRIADTVPDREEPPVVRFENKRPLSAASVAPDRMYTVLIPVDEAAAPARRQAAFVASLPAASESVEATLTHSMAANESLEEDEFASMSQVESVRAAKDHLVDNDVDVETMAVSLPLEEGIPQLAEQIDADQIVMGGRKRSAAGKALFGSTTQAVILNTNRSVTVIGTQD